MDVRSPFFQNIAAALAGILFLNPIMAAAAQATLASANGNTEVAQAGNGVPVVNIATPNGNGLSHNKFNQYNVGQQGLILNNSTAKTQSTQLGGIILGNANLKGQAAKLILNEVTGGSPSQLRGYTEVAGQKAHVVVANPNGITCNGCGFINTPRATLTTGKPIIEGGRLDRLQVEGGAISIEGQGLNASNVDQFDLITRSARINAELHANKLNIITGANDVEVADLTVSKRAANKADEPQLAIDSSALGGMYAGAIRLVGTEAGVGVKLAGNMAASAGDIQIDASGQLSLAQTVASGSVRIAADNLEANGKLYAGNSISAQVDGQLRNQQSLAARNSVTLGADELVNRGVVEAGVNPDGSRNASGDLSITARELDNRDGTLAASRQLQAKASEALDNQGGTLSAGSQAKVSSASLDNRGGRVLAQGELTVTTDALDNSGEGLVYGQQRVAVQTGTLDNRTGQISSKGQAEVVATSLDNRQGSLVSEGGVAVEAQSLDNRGGLVSGWQGLEVEGGTLDNSASGTLSSKSGALTVRLQGEVNNSGQGALVSKGDLRVQAASLDNSAAGVISSQARVELALNDRLVNQSGLVSSQGDLQIEAAEIDNRSGEIGSGGNLLLRGNGLDNGSGRLIAEGGFTLELLGLLNNAGGQLASAGNLLLSSGSLDNRGGQLASQGLLELLTGDLDNSAGGTLAARDRLQITASGQLDNGQDGLIYSERDNVEIAAAGLDNSAGSITSKGQLGLTLDGALNNRQGTLQSAEGDLDITAASLDNSDAGLLASLGGWLRLQLSGLFDNRDGTAQGESLEVVSGDLHNDGGHLSATLGDANISADAVENGSGGLFAKGLLSVIADSFGNQGSGTADEQRGKVAAQQIDFGLSGALNNRYGLIESGSTLTIEAASLDNSQGKLRAIGSTGESLIDVGLLDNRSGLVEIGNSVLRLQLDDLKNAGGEIRHTGSDNLALASARAIAAGGTLATSGELNISAQSWTNSGILQAARLLLNVNQFNQTASGQLLAGEALTATGGSWINNGVIASDGDLSLILSGAYSGSGKLTSLGDLTLKAASLTLGSTGRISGGGLTDIDIDGILANSGKITSAKDLKVAAATLNNYGTLGSGENLRLGASNLLNDRGLIFSGEDMALRVNNFINSYADVYSLGKLSLAKDDANNHSSLLENISATIESAEDMSLRAVFLVNRRDVIEVGERKVSGDIRYSCSNCEGSNYDLWYYVTEVYETYVKANSPSSSIMSGGKLGIDAVGLANKSSLVSAVGDIDIKALNFSNEGVALESVTHQSRYKNPADSESGSVFIGLVSPGGDLYEYNKYNARYLHSYVDENGNYYYKRLNEITDVLNPDFDLSRNVPVPAKILSYGVWESRQTATQTGVGAQAVIQSSGKVTINASESFNNSVIKVNAPVGLGADRTGSTVGQGTGATFLFHLNSQLPPDLAQKQINPLSLPGFSIPQGENGLFRLSGTGGAQSQTVDGVAAASLSSRQPGAHRYLIETNPELTNLKSFMGSDYLLGLLGYDLDKVSQRLGDGLFEQRLMREAIVARTGQRFLAGLTSDEAMFKYLMDNAVASKQALNLSLGVSLTAEQVAALTHDIVWLEEHEVMGQKVLVPVLYLAQAEGRLAANGALIQGRDVSLIGGAELNNQGTLRASDNLSITGRNIVNAGGLMEAGQRLDLLATDSIRNAQGGIISGRDVSVTAVMGDVINERSIATYNDHSTNFGYGQWSRDFVDNAAHIEAGDSLSISAGRNIANVGSVMSSGGDIVLDAGQDVVIAAAERNFDFNSGRDYTISQTDQFGAQISAGRDVTINAERDIAVVASDVEAERGIAMLSGRDVTISSAANEDHFYSKGDDTTRQENHVRQESSDIKAGGDLYISSDRDLTFIASNAEAGGEAYLVAGGNLSVLAAQDSDYSLFEEEKDGSWGSSEYQRDEVTDIRNIGSTIKAGGDVTLVSEGNQHYQGARIESGGDLTLDSGGNIFFEAVKDLHQESHDESDSSWAWNSSSGEGRTDESLRQSVLIAKGDVLIKAAEGIQIDIKNINQKTVTQTIDAMVQADPELAWLKEADIRGEIDWRKVKELHDSWDYEHSGLGGPAMMIIAIIVTYLTWGAGSSLVGVASNSAAGVAANSVVSAVAVNATTSTINNKGDLSAVVEDVTSSDAIKGYVTAGISGGLGGTNIALQLAVNSALDTALRGGSFKDNLVDGALQLAASAIAGSIYGQVGDSLKGTGIATKTAVHAIVGGLIAEAAGGDFKTAALAAGANQLILDLVGDKIFPGEAHDRVVAMTSQLIGIVVADAAGGSTKDQEVAGWVNVQATLNNYLNHDEVDKLAEELIQCRSKADPQACRTQVKTDFETVSGTKTGIDLSGCKRGGEQLCLDQLNAAEAGTTALDKYLELVSFSDEERAIMEDFQAINESDERIAYTEWLRPFWEGSGAAAGVLGGVVAVAGKGKSTATTLIDEAKGILTPKDFPDVSTKISQKQLRHIAGTQQLEARGGGGFLNSVSDAQKVLDAYHAGQVKILGRNAQGFPVVKFEGITGTNVNLGVGITDQATNVFIIKGTKSPSIVPTNPNWSPK
ncbi:filamentous hemagglutinin N-terminal domain-containing protein [Pseudomonas sp. zbq_18]|uniref:two-partner secretion domain-containing protein n=1 Tax=Pseudomonadota TaxID=1224 RepID=UPI00370A8FB0